jgi:hypothetical protein
MKRTVGLPLIALALVTAACTGSDSATVDGSTASSEVPVTSAAGTPPATDPDGGPQGPIGFAPAALQQFGDCSAFLDYVHTEGADRVGPYGFGNNGFFGPVNDFAFEEEDAAPAATEASAEADTVSSGARDPAGDRATSKGGGDGTYSTTNVQVDGVDEPDIVKTDGDRIIAITGEMLHYIDIAGDGVTGTKRGSVALNGQNGSYTYGHEIFLAGDRAFVFAQGEFYGGYPEPAFIDDVAVTTAAPVQEEGDEEVPTETIDAPLDEPDAEASFAETEPAPEDEPIPVEPDFPIGGPVGPGSYQGPQTLIIEVDLSNPDAPAVVNTMSIDGRYISARSIGDTARIVVTSPPQDLGFLYPSNPGTEQKAQETNREVVRNSTEKDWLPEFRIDRIDGSAEEGQLVDCASVFAPADFGGFDMLSIVTLDLGADLAAPIGTSSVMATGDTVYASQDRMYVSTNIWTPFINEQTNEWLDENYETAIHRFSIAGAGAARYEASGSVEGHLLNQFSMNDRDGVFYVATTKGAPWAESSESQIVSMEVNGDQLEQIGSVGGLGLGERIFSVRYVDDTAYVVTFRQVDPFYVIDLSDPRNMVVQGELKIPGFSNYLHPISDDLVIGVGQDATDDGRTTGTKVSLFDVSDPTNPLEIDVWTLPNAFSDAQFDHRAFLWWGPTNTAVLPLQSYGDQFAGAIVLNVTADGITEQGRISHVDDDGLPNGQTDCEVIDSSQFGEDSEFFWIGQEGGQIQLCTSQDQGGATGLFCDPVPVDELENWWGIPAEQLDIDTSGFERIELCWPNWNGYEAAIQRTMVIAGSLWTLSPTTIQSNDLTSLDRTGQISL